MAPKSTFEDYTAPAGGWGSAKSVARTLLDDGIPLRGTQALLHQNKADGFACVSCAWAKPAEPHPFEFCEEGAKATGWELMSGRCTPELLGQHTVAALEEMDDHELEKLGRLTHPMVWDAASDTYRAVSWNDAFQAIGAELKAMSPEEVVFYSSGRASLETSYMWSLLARMYGNNNLPDSSNMCHESTSVALPESIGVPVGTILLDDFKKTDCILIFGHNTGVNSPRMLHELQPCAERGVPIVTFNPLRERGLERFTDPQSPLQMATGGETVISSHYHQVRAGGDAACLFGICKALIATDDEALKSGAPRVLDADFIAQHTHGFEAFAAATRAKSWSDLERRSGLGRSAMEGTAAIYARAEAAMGIYGMGLTQHIAGVTNCQMLVNLLLLRGNIGKPGAGILPVRGHSNVQGQRTVGITEKPELVPCDRLEELYGFAVPRKKGRNTVETCEGVIDGSVKAVFQLGGNLVRAIPDHGVVVPKWRELRLTVQILTTLNRSCLVHGAVSYILPCRGRIEIDQQASGPQSVSVEDSTACIHASRGRATPASKHLLSEPAIVAGLANAILAPNPKVDWAGWVADYSRVRDAIEATYPDQFQDFNRRMGQPGGFPRPLGARNRQWKTKTGKANFIFPDTLVEDVDTAPGERDIVQLITLRAQGQFNTTVYSYRDRFRGVDGTRMVLFMHRDDIDRLGFAEGARVKLATAIDDGVSRVVDGFTIHGYDIPEGCIGGYYPECNPLIPLAHHAVGSKVPAAKSIPVRVLASATPSTGAAPETDDK